MGKRVWWSTLCIAILAAWIFPIIAQAYTIENFYVQQRYYEDKTKGPNGNGQLVRVWFDIKDANGAYITKNLLTSVALYDPNGEQVDDVTLAGLTFDPAYTEVDGKYDGTTGFWTYGDPYVTTGYYCALGKGYTLIAGNYRIAAVYDGESLEKTFDFVSKVALPIVSGKTIAYHYDNKGNFVSTWDISDILLRTFPTAGTSSRVIIEAYKKVSATKKRLAYTLNVRVPTASGILYVPKALITALKKAGTMYYLTVQVRTNDGCNRSYSNPVTLTLK